MEFLYTYKEHQETLLLLQHTHIHTLYMILEVKIFDRVWLLERTEGVQGDSSSQEQQVQTDKFCYNLPID